MLKTQLRVDNVMMLNCEDLSQLQLDNHSADNPVDNFVTNLYNNTLNQQSFLELDKYDYQPTFFDGIDHQLAFKFTDIFPCFADDFILVKNQMIINF